MLTFDEILERLQKASEIERDFVVQELWRVLQADADDGDFTYHLRDFGMVIFEIICPPEPEPEDEETEPPIMTYEQAPFYCRRCESAEVFNLMGGNWVCSKCGYVRWAFPSIKSLKND